MSRFKGVMASVAAAATLAVGGALVVSAAPVQAAEVYTLGNNQIVVLKLNHAETVAAADVGAGQVINTILGNDHWSVGLHPASRYQKGWYYRPDKATVWNDVTGQQVIAEAAAHPGGYVLLAVSAQQPDTPLWVSQNW